MDMPVNNPPIQIIPPEEGWAHTHTVILLHGKGSDGYKFSVELSAIEASEPAGQPRTMCDLFPTIRWVFPFAPTSYSERLGQDVSQWFDIWSMQDPNERPELQTYGLKESIELVMDIVQKEEDLVPRGNIFLGGIGQGFATAFATFLFGEKDYAGLIGLYGWAPSAALELLDEELDEAPDSEEREEIPVFIGHSRDDRIVPLEEARRLCNILWKRADTVVEFHEYPQGGHWINVPTGVDDIVEFLYNNMHIE